MNTRCLESITISLIKQFTLTYPYVLLAITPSLCSFWSGNFLVWCVKWKFSYINSWQECYPGIFLMIWKDDVSVLNHLNFFNLNDQVHQYPLAQEQHKSDMLTGQINWVVTAPLFCQGSAKQVDCTLQFFLPHTFLWTAPSIPLAPTCITLCTQPLPILPFLCHLPVSHWIMVYLSRSDAVVSFEYI